MAKRKLEGTVYLDPQNKQGSLEKLQRLAQARRESETALCPDVRDLINNMVIHTYSLCKQKGAREDEIIAAVSSPKEARY